MDKARGLNEINEMVRQYTYDLQADPYRLAFHLTPPFGLLNDPNGLIYYKGHYHVFFQWNPWATDHSYKCWGHYRTKDLITWELLPPALLPEDWFDKNGCYSGSAIEHEGKLYLFYTGNVKNSEGERESYQCVAISEDGLHFEKKGPVIHVPEGYTAHFRDPKVWKKNNQFFMVIGAQTADEKGCTVLFVSSDLNEWEFLGPIAGNGINGLENFGYMWECPDFFELDEKYVLLVSPQGLEPKGYSYQNLFQSGYLVGSWNHEEPILQHRAFVEIDRGFDFYAPQTFVDHKGRRIMLAWMGMGDDLEQAHLSIKSGWIHALTVPRELSLKDGEIYQKPLVELQQLRTDRIAKDLHLTDENISIDIPDFQQEILLEFESDEWSSFDFELGQAFSIHFNCNEKRVSLKRKAFNDSGVEERHAELKELKNLHIYLDRSSLEIFINDGKEAFTARFYPAKDDTSIQLSVKGSSRIRWSSWTLKNYDIVKL